ncbi:ORF MSV095 hypothetical protein [Melanoplus sanguinipes entomopoxvirus]|uniref:Uncharacterized protein n=1 Tax=Melanoplus sanguinipes entomopoxvirus TaxID=83191 RepID=Q9YVZ7_MSEPV|nr:ORF MSV095 hypothetical protein [Melanoplus sanguinipes entomopoxvirus]AAC97644.1 ORF MSV095 hypothetical protein [Melanoplus sanguinipes entomopoxvirus 'O']
MTDKLRITLCSTILNLDENDKEYFLNEILQIFTEKKKLKVNQENTNINIIIIIISVIIVLIIIILVIVFVFIPSIKNKKR